MNIIKHSQYIPLSIGLAKDRCNVFPFWPYTKYERPSCIRLWSLIIPGLFMDEWRVLKSLAVGTWIECIIYFLMYKPERWGENEAIQFNMFMSGVYYWEIYISLMWLLTCLYIYNKCLQIVQGRDIPIVHRVIEVWMTYIFRSTSFYYSFCLHNS